MHFIFDLMSTYYTAVTETAVIRIKAKNYTKARERVKEVITKIDKKEVFIFNKGESIEFRKPE